jgi:hypothetical protein
MGDQLDVLALHQAEKAVRDQVLVLQMMRDAEVTDSGAYYRAVLMLTKPFLDIDAVDQALALLKLIPESYFREVLPKHMDEDAELHAVAGKAATALLERGHVRLDTSFTPDLHTNEGKA